MNKKIPLIGGMVVSTLILAFIGVGVWYLFNAGQGGAKPAPLPKPEPIIQENFPLIKASLQTEFAAYTPNPSSITPSAESYSLPVDLEKLANKSEYAVSDAARTLLTKNGFVATPTYSDTMTDLYTYDETGNHPNFVTTDSILHAFHILYDFSLRHVEINKFYPEIKQLTAALLGTALGDYKTLQSTGLKQIAEKDIAYLAVAQKLLNPDYEPPAFVADKVNQEIDLISWHNRMQASPIFGYDEDYSQYTPRGHYTRNEDFQRYFKTMMWYGRMQFRNALDDQAQTRDETRAAILLVGWMNNTKIDEKDAIDVWKDIYQPTVFFVGKSDDLTIADYSGIGQTIFADSKDATTVLLDNKKIDQFIEETKKLPSPKITSSFIQDTQNAQSATKAFRFMGQRFIPDSYMFQNLVYPKVTNYTGNDPRPFTAVQSQAGIVRGFPRGLDVAAVLGSKRAAAILEGEKDSAYTNYAVVAAKLRDEFLTLPQEQYAENLYWNWLYALLPTLSIKGVGYPIFMQQQSWRDKDLNSFLGSWTELRHDTILYAKQSYTFGAGAAPGGQDFVKPPKKDRGYVEPNPEVYGRLAALAEYMNEDLSNRNLLSEEYVKKLNELEQVNTTLKGIAEKELTNRALGADEYKYIREIGGTLATLVDFSSEETEKIASGTDEKIDVIADVHTDGNSSQVLEEGIGKPFRLLVVVKNGGELYYASGPLFSYYEFKQPLSDRLTDEKWQEMEKPPLPSFTTSFVREE
ncbi:DUF3160 domain-containing protein [Candidatus Uhrbacteria bacterium]|nr:DUF3160 domain-containing protein [Candidatus Uhrbacteria bacterium]